MKKYAFGIGLSISVLIIASISAIAQDSRILAAAGDKYVISARAGGVNRTEGAVSIARVDGTGGALIKGDNVEIGDRVRTGVNGKAEILLNPGSYVRLGDNADFEFVSTSLDDLSVKLHSGSAIFEVIAANDFRVSVGTPSGGTSLTRSGVYRFDVMADGQGRVSVTKGRLTLGDQTQVKAGRMALVGNGHAEIAKAANDESDDLGVWSRNRAKELSKINAGLQRKAMRSTLISSFNRNGWDLYHSFGLWVYDPFRLSWCFMPFGSGWGSPYGYGYYFDIWYTRLPIWIYNQPPPVPSPAGGGAKAGGIVRQPPENGGLNDRRTRAPFEVIQQNTKGSGDGVVVRHAPMPRDDDWGRPSMAPAAPPKIPEAAPISLPPIRSGGKMEKPD